MTARTTCKGTELDLHQKDRIRKRPVTKTIRIWLFITLFALPALASTYYVDINKGDDAYSAIQAQNPSTPWRTITHAAATAPGGSSGSPTIIRVDAGVYSTGAGESLPITFSQPNIEVIGAGISTTTLKTGFKTTTETPRDTLLIIAESPGFSISGFTFREAANAITLKSGGANIHDNHFASDLSGEIRTAISLLVIERPMTLDLILDPVIVANNTIQARYEGIWVGLVFDLRNSDVGLSIGDLVVENNSFEMSGYSRGVQIEVLEIENGVGARVSVGEIRISGNDFTGGAFGIETTGAISNLADCEVTTGPITIKDNQFLLQDHTAVSLDFYDVQYWSGSSTGALGGVIFTGNTIDTPDAAGLLVEEIGEFRFLSDETELTVGPVSVTGNTIHAGLFDGVGIDILRVGGLTDQSLDNLTISNNTITTSGSAGGIRLTYQSISSALLGDVDLSNNTIDATGLGIDVSHLAFGEHLHGAGSFESGRLTIGNNIVSSSADDGVRVVYASAGYANDGESHTEIGPVFMHGNQISATDGSGLLLSLVQVASGLSENAVVTTADLFIGGPEAEDANIIAGTTEALRIDLDESATWNMGTSTASMGNIHIENNTLLSSDGDGIGIHVANPGEGAMDQSRVSLPSIVATNNDIDAPFAGILIDEVHVAELFDQPIVRLGEFSVTANRIGTGGHTPQHGIRIARTWTPDPIAATSDTVAFLLGDILVADNEIFGVVEDGIRIQIDGFGEQFDESCRLDLGGVEVAGNTIDGAGRGIFTTLTGSSHDNALIQGGRLEIVGNSIAGIGSNGQGVVVRHDVQTDDTSTMMLSGPVLRDNTVLGAGLHGIRVSRSVVSNGGALTIESPLVESNTVQGWGTGLNLADVDGARIFGNALSSNHNGILVEGIDQGISIRRNNIVDNSGSGAVNNGSNWIDGEDNWWGHASGPYDPIGTVEVPPETADPSLEKNTDGLGNAVSEGIDYCMWTLEPWPLPYLFADGFERGDSTRWDSTIP